MYICDMKYTLLLLLFPLMIFSQNPEINWLFPSSFNLVNISNSGESFLISSGGMIKLNSSGEELFNKVFFSNSTFNNSGVETAYTPSISSSTIINDYIYISGSFVNHINIDNQYNTTCIDCLGSFSEVDVCPFIAKFNINGELIWFLKLYDSYSDIFNTCINPNVSVIGLGGVNDEIYMFTQSGSQMMMLKLNPNGSLIEAINLSSGQFKGVFVENEESIIIKAYDPNEEINTIYKYNGTGEVIWSTSFSGITNNLYGDPTSICMSNTTVVSLVSIPQNQNIYIDDNLIQYSEESSSMLFALNTVDGSLSWSKIFPNVLTNIDFDQSGNIYAVGDLGGSNFFEQVTLEGLDGEVIITASNEGCNTTPSVLDFCPMGLFLRFNNDGLLSWSSSYPNIIPRNVSLNKFNNIIMIGASSYFYSYNPIIDNLSFSGWNFINYNGNNMLLGCTDVLACNYNEYATDNNNSCEYPDQFLDCEGNLEEEYVNILDSLDNNLDTFIYGDVNCDGEVNSQDAALILQYITGLIEDLPYGDLCE